jgi:hypothetical protein
MINKIQKGKERVKGRNWMFFLREGGVRLGLVVEEEGERRVGDELVCDTHPLQCRGLELDRQEKSATEVCESSFSFFLREKVGRETQIG